MSPKNKSKGVTVDELLPSWEADLVGAQGLGERTVQEYRRHVVATLRYLAADLECEPHEVPVGVGRTALVSALAAWRFAPDARCSDPARAGGERAPHSVGRRIAALRSFFGWCVDEGHLESSPAERLKAPKSAPRPPAGVKSSDLEDVVAGAKMSRAAERDTLLVMLHLTCGLSLGEVASLEVPATIGGSVEVVSRGRTRKVALSPAAWRAVETYLPVRQALLDKHGLTSRRLLLSVRPRTETRTGEVTLDPRPNSLLEATERALARAGVKVRGVGTHALRVSYARAALSDGSQSLGILQHQLGHTSPASLRHWVEVTEREGERAAASHPFANLA